MEKKLTTCFRLILVLSFGLSTLLAMAAPNAPKPAVYQVRIYHFKDSIQERALDAYFERAFLPALHRAGIPKAGVFKVIANDTLTDKMIYVLIPFKSLQQFQKMESTLIKDKSYQSAATSYINAMYKDPSFVRMESILLDAFPMAPQLELPDHRTTLAERVYELRSYESPTEKYHRNKVDMFNMGGEIALFKRLGFNAVFYGSVISGSHMPNLMYMTSFENRAARDAHWKIFSADPEWKKLSAMPEYQNNVSHIDITFLRPVKYSDF